MSRRPKYRTKLDQELYVQLEQEYATQNTALAITLQQTNAPSGTIVAFSGSLIPNGWLLCNGLAISRTTYASLFSAIGITHGYGDNSTTFNLPNYQGRFLRGVDNSAGNDPDRLLRSSMAIGGNTGNNVGSIQNDAFQNITGSLNTTYAVVRSGQTGALVNSRFDGGTVISSPPYGTSASFGTIDFNASNSPGARTSTETRVKNAYVNYIIKF